MIESLSSIIAYFGKNTWLGDAGIVMFLGGEFGVHCHAISLSKDNNQTKTTCTPYQPNAL